jgi:hypothetical protein
MLRLRLLAIRITFGYVRRPEVGFRRNSRGTDKPSIGTDIGGGQVTPVQPPEPHRVLPYPCHPVGWLKESS